MSKQIKISVRNLVEFILRSGDIDNTFVSSTRALEGTRAYQKVQRSYGGEEYTPGGVVLRHILNYEDFTIDIEGRADGILIENENIIID